jgi:hypothetical protein
MQVFIGVAEAIPVDSLIKMPDSERELSELTEKLALK